MASSLRESRNSNLNRGIPTRVSLVLAVTGTQQVERDLGRFDAKIQVGSVLPGQQPDSDALGRMRAAGARNVAQELWTTPFRVDQLPDERNVRVVEADWINNPLPDRYRLLSGRWPASPGEIAVTAEVAEQQPETADWTAFAGAAPLKRVGVVQDRYAQTSPAFLLAEGSWANWNIPDVNERYKSSGATIGYYWSGGDLDAVLNAAVAGAPETAKGEAQMSLLLRSGLDTRTVSGTQSNFPMLGGMTGLGVPLLAAWLGAALNRRWSARIARHLEQIGLPSKLGHTALITTTVVSMGVGLMLGFLTGAAVSAALRPILDTLSARPLSPWRRVPPCTRSGQGAAALPGRLRRDRAARRLGSACGPTPDPDHGRCSNPRRQCCSHGDHDHLCHGESHTTTGDPVGRRRNARRHARRRHGNRSTRRHTPPHPT